jgi:Domain of unknown function (DUF4395)
MPDSIPVGAADRLPPSRMIDPRGHRFGAGVSALLIAISFVLNAPLGVALAFLSIAVSGVFGLRYSIYGAIWRRIVRLAHLAPPRELEHEYPPRFAQVFGSVVLAVSLLAFAVGLTALGWLLAGAVAALQTVLAVTGYCLGCRLYFVRWWVPSLVTRFWRRGLVEPRTPLRY